MARHNGSAPTASMRGKIAVVTGGNTGIGKETAAALVEGGATVVITARDAGRGEAAVADIRARTNGAPAAGTVEVMHLDLARLASVRQFAAELLDRHDQLDVLVNNAGLALSDRRVTEDGFEMTFAVNHLGPFLLTTLLLERLRADPAGARIVNVASHAHKMARGGLDFDDLQSERNYAAFPVYSRSKLANLLFTRELSKRLAGEGVTANALHPGFVRTDFARHGDTHGLYALGTRLGAPFALSPAKGARTSLYLASSPDVEGMTGKYFYKCRPVEPSRAARDDDAADRLQAVSEELVAAR